MMRLAILNQLTPKTPKVWSQREREKKNFRKHLLSKKSLFQTSSKIIARPKYSGKWEKSMGTCRKLTNIEEYH
jgi:hypothetical protein